jgi:hypothetical protein
MWRRGQSGERIVSFGAQVGTSSGQSSRDRITVASEKADFIADRIAAGVAAPEKELRKLARYLREIAAAMGPGSKNGRATRPAGGPEGSGTPPPSAG